MTQPTPPMTAAQLDRAIIGTAREYIAAQRARPVDPQRVADAKAALDALIAARDAI